MQKYASITSMIEMGHSIAAKYADWHPKSKVDLPVDEPEKAVEQQKISDKLSDSHDVAQFNDEKNKQEWQVPEALKHAGKIMIRNVATGQTTYGILSSDQIRMGERLNLYQNNNWSRLAISTSPVQDVSLIDCDKMMIRTKNSVYELSPVLSDERQEVPVGDEKNKQEWQVPEAFEKKFTQELIESAHDLVSSVDAYINTMELYAKRKSGFETSLPEYRAQLSTYWRSMNSKLDDVNEAIARGYSELENTRKNLSKAINITHRILTELSDKSDWQQINNVDDLVRLFWESGVGGWDWR